MTKCLDREGNLIDQVDDKPEDDLTGVNGYWIDDDGDLWICNDSGWIFIGPKNEFTDLIKEMEKNER